MNKKIVYIIEKYKEFKNEFNEKYDKCTSVTDILYEYSGYTGKLEGLLDILTMEVKND